MYFLIYILVRTSATSVTNQFITVLVSSQLIMNAYLKMLLLPLFKTAKSIFVDNCQFHQQFTSSLFSQKSFAML